MLDDRTVEYQAASALRAKREELFWGYAFSNARNDGDNPYSQRSVGEGIGASEQTLYNWENGRSFPRHQRAWEAWARYLGAEIEFRVEAA